MAASFLSASLASLAEHVMPSSLVAESALTRARRLAKELPDPANTSVTGGELELHDWWVANAALLDEARVEYGKLHPALYDMEAHQSDFIQPVVTQAVEACERAAKAGLAVPEDAVRALLRPAGAPGVWRLPLFTDRFCTMLLEELAHYERSGLPLRRPNGMNRYGAILDELGFSTSLDYLCRRYLRPLGQMLYPRLIASGDADEHYGFVVKYKNGQDVSLAEHADASVLTLNANLGIRGFRGGALTFRGTRGVDERPKEVPVSTVDFSDFSPGEAILHLGGQYHAALPIESGERVNMVVWQFAQYEVVRFAPYEECERLSARQRWSAFPYERERPQWMSLVPTKANKYKCAPSQADAVDGQGGAAGAAAAEEREERAMYDEL